MKWLEENPLITGLKILSLPLVEFILLRCLLFYIVDLHPGFVSMTEFDLVLPSLFAGIGLFWVLIRKEPLYLSFRIRGFLINVFWIACFLAVSIGMKAGLVSSQGTGYWTWFFLGVVSIFSSLWVRMPISYVVRHPDRYLVFPALLVCLSKILGHTFFQSLWEPVGRITGKISYYSLSLFIPDLTFYLRQVGEASYSQVIHPNYTMAIGKGCSGLEGVFFFLTTWSFVWLLEAKKFSSWFWVATFGVGVFYLYAINLLRLFIFYLVSLISVQTWGAETGILVSLVSFHDSLGWCLYTGAIFFFYHVTSFIYLKIKEGMAIPGLSLPALSEV